MVRRPAGRAGATAEQTRPVMSRSVADPLLVQQAGAVIELVLNRPMLMTTSISWAPLSMAASVSNRLLSESVAPSGKPTTVATFTSLPPRKSRARTTHDPWTQTAILSSCTATAPALLETLAQDKEFTDWSKPPPPQLFRRLAALVGADAAHEILVTSRSFEAAEAERLGFVQRLAEPGAWPEIVRGIVDAQKLDGIATVRLKARVKPDMRACDMAALVDSAATPGLKDRIRAFRSAEN